MLKSRKSFNVGGCFNKKTEHLCLGDLLILEISVDLRGESQESFS